MISSPYNLASVAVVASSLATIPGGSGADQALIEIEHRFGTTVIDETPRRVVSLGAQWTDVLVAMGVEPVGYLEDQLAGDSGLYPWQTDLPADAAAVTYGDALPLERIAAMEPDLIVAGFVAAERADYDALASIAPTIGPLGDRQVDRWQDLVAVGGEVFREPVRAQQVIDDVDELVADTAADLPGLDGGTYALVNYIPGDRIVAVADPDDGAAALFAELGMEIDPDLLAAADGVSGRVDISLEQTAMLDADVLVIYSNGGDPHDLIGYDDLPAVAGGAAADVDYSTVVGLNTPTPLSIPYSLEVIRPALESAEVQS